MSSPYADQQYDDADGGADYAEYHDEGEYQHEGKDGGGKSFTGACVTMLFGCLLFPAALCTLGWNEKNNVCQQNLIMTAEEKAVVGDCGDASSVEGKFTFFSCPIADKNMTSMSPLTSFNLPGLEELVSFNTVAGAQKVEMFQCIETKEEGKQVKEGEVGTLIQKHENRARKSSFLAHAGGALASVEIGTLGTLVQKHENRARKSSSLAHAGEALALDEVEENEETNDLIRTEKDPHKSSSSKEKKSVSNYKYRMGWSDVYYNSAEFKATPYNIAAAGCPDYLYKGQVNPNPKAPDRGDGHPVELGTQKIIATSVIAGAYTFSDEEQLKKLTAEERVSLTPFMSKFTLPVGTDNIVTAISKRTVSVHAKQPNYLATCKSDRLGCVRISYNKSAATHISSIGLVGASGVMTPQNIAKTWGCPTTDFIRMYPREMTKEEMIAEMRKENHATTWVLRLVGLLAAWFGLYCCFDPIASAADKMGDVLSYIPCFGPMLSSALEGIVEMFLCIISCGFGMSFGLFVIAVVWLGMRPMIGGPLMAASLALLLVGYCAMRKSERDPKKMRKGKQLYAEQQPPHHEQQPAYEEELAPGASSTNY